MKQDVENKYGHDEKDKKYDPTEFTRFNFSFQCN